MDETPNPKPTHARGGRGNSGVRIGAVIAVALAAAFVAWLLIKQDDSPTSTTPTTATTPATLSTPKAITQAGLQKLASDGRTIYWAGPKQAGETLTFLESSKGDVYVRYLPAGVTATDPIPASLVVGTYPLKDALAAVQRTAKKSGSVSVSLDGGGVAVYAKSRPTNVYFAYPKARFQIEVYDPTPGRALERVTSGTVTQITP